jgi:5-methyltetrahydropteroyltriglutamate--homocysteine methyltransferase
MRRSGDHILTTHCGSLPRPPEIVALVESVELGRPFDAGEFETTIREAVAAAVRRQAQAGIAVVNDGEQSKFNFGSYFQRRLRGFTLSQTSSSARRSAELAAYPDYFERKWPYRGSRLRATCTGPISYISLDAVRRDLANLKSVAAATVWEELFMTAVSPGTVLSNTPNQHYSSEEEYHQALCDALSVEYEAIVSEGVLLQLDCPDFGRTPRVQEITLEDHLKLVARNIELLNYATRNIPPESMRFHVCWGADEAPHTYDPPLESMIRLLIKGRPQGITIAAANGRHEHEWSVWKDVKLPDGKVLIPGVIDSTTNIVEHPETVAERIDRFASVVGRENLIAGVDCGFDTVAGVEQVDGEIAYAKLAALAEGARIASRHR